MDAEDIIQGSVILRKQTARKLLTDQEIPETMFVEEALNKAQEFSDTGHDREAAVWLAIAEALETVQT